MGRPISSAVFREALARFASGVTIVTAPHPNGPAGFTATGFASASLEPPLILVCIDKDASAYDAVVAAEHFGVSILAEQQGWIARQFATTGVDRFLGVSHTLGSTAPVPLIEGAIVKLLCRRHALQEAGDHTILLGEVLEASVADGLPLLHFARRFGRFA
jgi:flavin reductase ActVB